MLTIMKKASSHKRRGFYAEHNRTQMQASSLIFQKPGFLQELAPSGASVAPRLPGFIGPVPPPLWIRESFLIHMMLLP
jgi:hypothetical protein